MKQRGVRATQSPMNAEIWFIDLACGHEIRVVQKQRPRLNTLSTVNGELMESPRMFMCVSCIAITATPKDRA